MRAVYEKTPGYHALEADSVWMHIESAENDDVWESEDDKDVPAFLAFCQEYKIDTITRIVRWQYVYEWEEGEVRLEDFQP